MLSSEETLTETGADSLLIENAELVVSQLYVLPETVQSTDTVTLGADVRNDGVAESGVFHVRMTLDNTEPYEIQFPNLSPGESHWEEWQHSPLGVGEHTLSVELDAYNRVQEGNKHDNTASLSFRVDGDELLQDQTLALNEASELPDDEMLALDSDDSGKKKKAKDKPKVIDVGTIEVHVTVERLPPGKSSEEQINTLLTQLNIWIGKYWIAYRQGLLDFQITMDHSTFDEAKEDNIQKALKDIGIKLFDKVLDTVGDIPGPWGIVAKGLKAASHAWLDHQDKVEKKTAEDKKAKSEIKFAEYLISFGDASVAHENKMTAEVMKQEMPLAQELARIMKENDDGPATPDGIVVGEAAQYLRQLSERVEAFHAAIPDPPTFKLEFAERFAAMPGWTRHGESLGRPFAVYFNLKLRRELEWIVVDSSSAWTLVTDSSKSEALAKDIQEGLKKKGKKPWQADEVQKVVEIEFDDTVLRGSKWRGSVKFASAAPYEPIYGVPVAGGWVEEVEKAWAQPEISKIVLENDKIVGSND